MSTSRKIWVSLAALCGLTMASALIWLGFRVDKTCGVAAIGIVAWWLGSSIAEVLKENKEGK